MSETKVCQVCQKTFTPNLKTRGRPRMKCYDCQPDMVGKTLGMPKEQRANAVLQAKRDAGIIQAPRVTPVKVPREIPETKNTLEVVATPVKRFYEQAGPEFNPGDKLLWFSPVMFAATNENIQAYGHKVVLTDPEPNLTTGKVKVLAKHYDETNPVEVKPEHLWKEVK